MNEETEETKDITIDNFADIIDDNSWEEFMPRKVTKEKFQQFVKYYDPDIFRAAGQQIRDMARAADSLAPVERVKRIAEIFGYFRNPDKETVLTPWRVVNMHISDCLGGWDFYDETHDEEHGQLDKPRFVDRGQVTKDVFADPDTRILEINSKTGLYPLYMTYSIFAEKCRKYKEEHTLSTDLPDKQQQELWDDTLAHNVFVICKTPMAKSITRRTLRGFRNIKVNARYFEDLINQIKNKPKQFIERISNGQSYWKANNEQYMKFTAIVGNPPYQVMDGGTTTGAIPLYNKFVEISKKISPSYISMIMPAKWYNGGRNLDDFRESMLKDKRIQDLFDVIDSREVFPSVDVAGGICYFLWDKSYNGLCNFVSISKGVYNAKERNLGQYDNFIRYNDSLSIVEKILNLETNFYSEVVSAQKPFGLRTYARPCGSGDLMLKSSGGIGPFKREDVPSGIEWIDKWKVISSIRTVEHAGQADAEGKRKVLSTTEVLGPKWICTESYAVIDTFDTEREARNLYSYLMTKFVRFLLSLQTSSQALNRNSFTLVPLQDFSEPWTDEKLYKKYNLTQDEIEYIESLIKPME